mgnify:CR=1 FL=1
MSNTKIVVVKLKELLLTAVLVFIGILFILFGIAWVSTKKETSSNSPNPTTTPTSALYTPGVYTSSISIGDTLVHLELVCDENHINSVRLVNLDEAVTTMYPLLHPALEALELQLSKDIPLEELTLTEGSQYTQNLLIEAIENTLSKAELTQ